MILDITIPFLKCNFYPTLGVEGSGGISRPQVKTLFEFSDMGAGALFLRGNDFKGQKQQGNLDSISEQLLQPSKVTTITDNGSTQSHLRAIAASKRQKPQSHQVWYAINFFCVCLDSTIWRTFSGSSHC